MSDDEIDELYDQIADIEVDETVDADRDGRDLTERGKTAEGIVTVIGNELYRPMESPAWRTRSNPLRGGGIGRRFYHKPG